MLRWYVVMVEFDADPVHGKAAEALFRVQAIHAGEAMMIVHRLAPESSVREAEIESEDFLREWTWRK